MNLQNCHAGGLIDAVQTLALVVSMAAQLYVMNLLRVQMRDAASGLQNVIDGQAEASIRMRAIEDQLRNDRS